MTDTIEPRRREIPRISRFMLMMAVTGCGVAPAIAHHSTAAYDYSKTVAVAGTVKLFQWTNPHMYIKIVAPYQGKPTEWNIETGTPNINVRHGWKRNDIKPGDKVSVMVAPLRDGSAGGTLISIKLPDGRTLFGPAVDIRAASQRN